MLKNSKFQMNVPELPPFLLEPLAVDREREEFMKAMAGKSSMSEYDGQVCAELAMPMPSCVT